MRQSQSVRFRRSVAIAAATTAALALAACSAPASDDGAAPSEEPLQIAYISFAVANTYDEPMLAAAQEVAAANNAEISVFDGNLDPNLQVTLIQDVIASGQYDGMITQPIYGPAIIDVVKQAIEAGITVVTFFAGATATTLSDQVMRWVGYWGVGVFALALALGSLTLALVANQVIRQPRSM